MEFEWDSEKAQSNLIKHGLSFDAAATALGDPLSLTIADPDHSDDEIASSCSVSHIRVVW